LTVFLVATWDEYSGIHRISLSFVVVATLLTVIFYTNTVKLFILLQQQYFFLGVGIMIDERLTFKQNTELVIRKISKKVFFLTRMKKMINKETKILLNKTLIQPHLGYCSSILFLSCDQELKRIQKTKHSGQFYLEISV
jgi:hypothetical protein